MLEINFIILGVLILLSAIFSGTETALMSVNMIKVRSLLKQKRKGAETLHRLKQNPHRLIITILIGNNLVNIGAASLATIVFTNMFGSSGVGIATGIMTFLILVFGEITPKTFATQNAVSISLKVARPIELMSLILYPIVRIFEIIARVMSKLLGSKEGSKISEGELRAMVTMGHEEGILDREAAEMMKNVLKFRKTRVIDIMTKKDYMKVVNGDKKLGDVVDFVIKSPYSRFPVITKGKITGVLDVDDVLKYFKKRQLNIKIDKIAQDIYFVPESKEIDDLLTEFEGKKIPIAVVVDEYGKYSGLVTIEDILEEIVGDIFDKSKRDSVHIKKVSDKLIRVDARASIEEVNDVLHLGIKKGDFETIAGYVQHRLKRIPKKGEKIELRKVIIEVGKVHDQRIESVNVIKK